MNSGVNDPVLAQRRYYTETASRYDAMHAHEAVDDDAGMQRLFSVLRTLTLAPPPVAACPNCPRDFRMLSSAASNRWRRWYGREFLPASTRVCPSSWPAETPFPLPTNPSTQFANSAFFITSPNRRASSERCSALPEMSWPSLTPIALGRGLCRSESSSCYSTS